mmetsp:Transcript_21186/g.34969  ORF Transcript_21186/g.34969 Transcript_21186/m.34969 type:complete len:105 (+) Transcript_21186:73-387(+)
MQTATNLIYRGSSSTLILQQRLVRSSFLATHHIEEGCAHANVSHDHAWLKKQILMVSENAVAVNLCAVNAAISRSIALEETNSGSECSHDSDSVVPCQVGTFAW